jgi:hypothetical protein
MPIERAGRVLKCWAEIVDELRTTLLANCMNRRKLGALLVAALQAPPLSAAPRSPRVSGIYSNLQFNREAGDLLGMELLIVPRDSDVPNSYTAFVQVAEGAEPYSAALPFILRGKMFDLVLPSGERYSGERLSAEFVGADITVRWRNGHEERLRRGKSYWQ